MKILIVVKLDEYTEAVVSELRAAGHKPTTLAAIPRTIFVDGDEALLAQISADKRVRGAVDGDAPAFKPGLVNEVIHTGASVTPDGESNWGIARMVRRDRPWPARIPLPFSTFFKAELDGSGVDFYLLDSGCQFDHPEFDRPGGGSRVTVMSYGPMSEALPDTIGHGTCVAAAFGGNISGIARGSDIWVYSNASNRDGTVSPTLVITQIDAIIAHYNSRAGLNRPAILNMSFEGVSGSAALIGPAVDAAISAGIICIAAAGNSNANIDSEAIYPAFFSGVLPVAATTIHDEVVRVRGFGTSYGNRAFMGAPGHLLKLATSYEYNATGYTMFSGTSFSAPFTAGVLACMLTGTARLTNQKQVRKALSRLWQNGTPGKILRPERGPVFAPQRLPYLDPNATTPRPEIDDMPADQDAFYPMIGFQMNMDQPNGSTVVADTGPVGRTTTVTGPVQFTDGALVINGNGHVTVSDGTEMRVGARDSQQPGFTVEMELSFDALTGATPTVVTGQWEEVAGGRIWAIRSSNGALSFSASGNGTSGVGLSLIPAGQMEIGRRYQIAVSYDGTNFFGYVDGMLVGSVQQIGVHSATRALGIGPYLSSNTLQMKVYKYRFTRAVCRYSSGFIGEFPAVFPAVCTRGYVGKGLVNFTFNATTVSVVMPIRMQNGDKLLAFIQTDAATVTAPAGWTLVTTIEVQNNTRRTVVFQRDGLSTDSGATVLFTLTGTVTIGSGYVALAFREPDLAFNTALLGGADYATDNMNRPFPRYENNTAGRKLVLFLQMMTYYPTDVRNTYTFTDGLTHITPLSVYQYQRMRLAFKYVEPGEAVQPLCRLVFDVAQNSIQPIRMATLVFDI